MIIAKKLLFVPFFLISFAALINQLSPVIKSADFIFSLSSDTLVQLLTICTLILMSSFWFTLFAALSSEWKFTIPVALLAAFSPFIFFEAGLAVVASVVILVSFLLIIVELENKLRTYLNFNAGNLLGPVIKHLSTLLILSIALIFFLSINQTISRQGFQIPDSVVDTALKFTPMPAEDPAQTISQISPQALKQAGIDPTGPLPSSLVKQAVKDQFQNSIKPYLNFVPPLLTVLLFFTLQSFASLINLLTYPILRLVFWILQKSNFIRFETEMREVKKLVV